MISVLILLVLAVVRVDVSIKTSSCVVVVLFVVALRNYGTRTFQIKKFRVVKVLHSGQFLNSPMPVNGFKYLFYSIMGNCRP